MDPILKFTSVIFYLVALQRQLHYLFEYVNNKSVDVMLAM